MFIFFDFLHNLSFFFLYFLPFTSSHFILFIKSDDFFMNVPNTKVRKEFAFAAGDPKFSNNQLLSCVLKASISLSEMLYIRQTFFFKLDFQHLVNQYFISFFLFLGLFFGILFKQNFYNLSTILIPHSFSSIHPSYKESDMGKKKNITRNTMDRISLQFQFQ